MAGLALMRKAGQVLGDPVLRRWIMGRALGRWAKVTQSGSHLPPYLDPSLTADDPRCPYSDAGDAAPQGGLDLMLAGEVTGLAPGDEPKLIGRGFADTESLLAMHRFAWIGPAGDDLDPAWVNDLWRAWMDKYEQPGDGWAWHPYTAAERLVNILNFARRHGLPGPRQRTLDCLAAHGPSILRHLEYYGPAHTGNHLANNGRGLFLGGLELGQKSWAEAGGQILIQTAKNLFQPSGILGEGSSHYHLLVSRWYGECWLAARRFGRPECHELEDITRRAFSVLSLLDLPAGLPLIGDISPDCPPAYLAGLLQGINSGWLAGLEEEERQALMALRPKKALVNADGWHRCDFQDWAFLCHAAPAGWSPMPGHGHRDLGGFELHHKGQRVFCDLGRRSYGPSGDGDISASAQNSLTVDGHDPYPPNRAYYSDVFRQSICGGPPAFSQDGNQMMLETESLSRLGNIGTWRRAWRFAPDHVVISDGLEGKGRHRVDRYLHTGLPVSLGEGETRVGPFRVSADVRPSLRDGDRWVEYGRSSPAAALCFSSRVQLPWTSTIKVELA